ncbi:AlpA family phage regulatory protein [Pseudoxanthomonas sp. CF125]|uniref:helix-turn-helix transcriptional regulator n=1 Tax=Pseudoxanthomonas sp. CF125 TaxID=1855303 RepID=UPI0008918D9F|nr:AlpA family phage regulatory protein [Pseudoxanthomonas sp. CF125]SDQ43588.1 transcriptional regulator, AlpA family [Pseudoxanthomonas sp. CF125]
MGAAESFLTMQGVRGRVGLCPSMIYRLVNQGQFPKPAKFGTRSLWIESEVDAWIAERIKLHNMGRNMGQDIAA